MAPFKAYYIQECEKFLRNNPGRAITQFQISKLLGEAFLRAAVPTTAINGFRKYGMYPYDPNVFCDADFLPSEVSDIPLNNDNNDESDNVIENQDTGLEENEDEPIATTEPRPSTSSGRNEDLSVAGPSRDRSSQSAFVVSPKEVMPLPKQTGITERKKNRKRGKTAIITASPFKNELLAEIKIRQEKETIKRKKIEMKKQIPQKKTNKKLKRLFVQRENLILKMKEKNQTWNKKKKIVCVFFVMNFFLHPKIMKAG